MPDLSDPNIGQTLVPDLSNALNIALNTFGTKQQRDRQRKLESSSQEALTTGNPQALARVAAIDPQAANALQGILDSQNEQLNAQAQAQAERAGKIALNLKGIKDPAARSKQAIVELQNMVQSGELPADQIENNPLMKLANEPDLAQQDLLIDKQILMAQDFASALAAANPKPQSVVGKIQADADAGLIDQATADAGILKATTDVKSPEAFNQSIQIAQAQAAAAQEVANRSPQARIQLQLSEQQLKAAKEERIRNEELADRATKKFEAKQRKAERNVKAAITEVDSFIANIDDLLKNPDLKDAFGLTGVIAAQKPGSNAATIREKIKQLEAKSGFKSLTELKAQGGTLGALSATELDLLVAQKGVLSVKQDVETFKKEITNMKENLLGTRTKLNDEFEIEFGDPDKAFSNQTTTIGEFEVKVVR